MSPGYIKDSIVKYLNGCSLFSSSSSIKNRSIDVSSINSDFIIRFNKGTQLILVVHTLLLKYCGIKVSCRVALFSLSFNT